MTYEQTRDIMIAELRVIEDNTKIRFSASHRSFSAKDMANEIEKETNIGMWYVSMRIKTEEKIHQILLKEFDKKENWLVTILKKLRIKK